MEFTDDSRLSAPCGGHGFSCDDDGELLSAAKELSDITAAEVKDHR
jgi:hypothetical protein